MSETNIFMYIAESCIALGYTNISDTLGCVEITLDDNWRIAINGHGETTKDTTGADVLPYCCMVWYNGWPAGVLCPNGGEIAAGAVANENALRAAIKNYVTTEKASNAPDNPR